MEKLAFDYRLTANGIKGCPKTGRDVAEMLIDFTCAYALRMGITYDKAALLTADRISGPDFVSIETDEVLIRFSTKL